MEKTEAMSNYFSKVCLISLLMISIQICAQTENLKLDSLTKKKIWTPHYAHLQYAGGMGFLSLGTGYYFNKRKMGIGPQIGYLPESIGGVKLITGTMKYFWTPFEIKKNRWRFYPLATGLNFIITFNEDIETYWEDYYPDGYYPWIPAFNWAFFVGGNVLLETDKNQPKKKQLVAFYEFAWTGRLVELWFLNTATVKFTQLWNLSLGVRYNFR